MVYIQCTSPGQAPVSAREGRNRGAARADTGAVAVARCILPGRIYLVTRHCTGRQFLLRPCPRMKQILEYCLGLWAARHGVRVVGYVVLSNHYHAIVYDPRGVVAAGPRVPLRTKALTWLR